MLKLVSRFVLEASAHALSALIAVIAGAGRNPSSLYGREAASVVISNRL